MHLKLGLAILQKPVAIAPRRSMTKAAVGLLACMKRSCVTAVMLGAYRPL